MPNVPISFNSLVNRTIVKVVTENPGITLRALETTVHNAVYAARTSSRDYFMGGGYFYQRVERIVKRGKLAKLIYKADGPHETLCGHYFAPDRIPACFDASVETDRLVAADYVQERDDEETAKALRRARRGQNRKAK